MHIIQQYKPFVIAAGLGLALLVAVGLHLLSTGRFGSFGETPTSTPNGVTVDIEGDGGTVVVMDENIPEPSLNGEVNYSASLSAAQKNALQSQIETTRGDLREDPSLFGEWLILGTYYRQAGDFKKAEEVLIYAGQLIPSNTTSFNNLGNLYHYDLKDFPKAEAAFRRAIQNDSTYVVSYKNLHELYAYSYKTNSTLAGDVLLEGLQKNPKHLDLLTTLARYYWLKNDPVNSRKYYLEARAEAEKGGNTNLVATIDQELSELK